MNKVLLVSALFLALVTVGAPPQAFGGIITYNGGNSWTVTGFEKTGTHPYTQNGTGLLHDATGPVTLSQGINLGYNNLAASQGVFVSSTAAHFTDYYQPQGIEYVVSGSPIWSGIFAGTASQTQDPGKIGASANGASGLPTTAWVDNTGLTVGDKVNGTFTWSNANGASPVLSFTAVPEPSTFAFMGLGVAGMLSFGLRRRKQ